MRRAAAVATLIVVAACGTLGLWWASTSRDNVVPARDDGRAPVVAPPAVPRPVERAAPRVEKPAVPAPAPADAPPPAVPGVVITGRVVDAALHVVAGAHVDATSPDGKPHATETDRAGRFRLDVGERGPSDVLLGGLRCVSDAGDVGVARYTVAVGAAEPFDVGTIQLGAGGTLDVHVTRDGADVEGAALRLLVVTPMWGGYGAAVRFGEATSDAGGRARFDHVPAGPALVLAYSAAAGRGGRDVVVRAGLAGVCELALTRRFVDVVVQTADASHAPIPGAVVDAQWGRRSSVVSWQQPFDPPLQIAPTDAAGATRIEVDEGSWLYVAVRAEGYAPRTELSMREADTELRVEMSPTRTVRWPIVVGDVVPPPPGAVIELRPRLGTDRTGMPPPGRMEGSDLVVDGIGPSGFSAIAVAPDGSVALLVADARADRGRQTSFVRPRSIDVWLTEEGAPLAGGYLLAINRGNNPSGRPVATDVSGHAVLTDFEGGTVAVHLVPSADWRYPAHELGSVNLDRGAGRIVADLPRARTIVASVTVDGAPGLPPALYVNATSGMSVTPVRDEEAATLTLHVRPSKPGEAIALDTVSQGLLPVHVDIPGAAWNEPVHVDIALQRGASLAGRVILPPSTTAALNVERDTPNGWMPVPAMGNLIMPLRPDAEGGVHIDGVVAGRFRLRDSITGAATPVIDVVAGESAQFPVLDLSAVGTAKGRVEGSDGTVPSGCLVCVDGEGIDQTDPSFRRAPHPGVAVASDGTFSVRVPGDRTVRLRAWHPTLVPAPEGGAVELVSARDGIVLRLVPGPTATFELSAAPDSAGYAERVRVLLFHGDPGPSPVAVPSVSVDGRKVTLGAYTPGTYTLWVDVAGFVPAVVRDVELRAGSTELPSVELARGSMIRVKLLTKQGDRSPTVYVYASSLVGPSYVRGLQGDGGAEVLVRGLGAGRFRVNCVLSTGTQRPFTPEVEVDGTNTVELEWDLR